LFSLHQWNHRDVVNNYHINLVPVSKTQMSYLGM